MVSPDRRADLVLSTEPAPPAEQVLYKVGVALRLVDRLLGELDVDASDGRSRIAAFAKSAAKRRTKQPTALTGRVAHALMLAEELGNENAGSDQLRQTLRGLLIDLERRPPRREAV